MFLSFSAHSRIFHAEGNSVEGFFSHSGKNIDSIGFPSLPCHKCPLKFFIALAKYSYFFFEMLINVGCSLRLSAGDT